jgi:inward rectifier potassium channel
MTDNDLGLGRVVAEQAEGRYLNKDGTPNSRKYGQGSQTWQRLYLKTLAATWPSFLMWAFGLILLVAGAFAVGYRSLGPEALSGTERLGLTDPFFATFAYSVAIITGVGAGPIVAVGSSAQWLTIVESLAGLVALALGGGLTLARLSRPRARIQFSRRAVIAPYHGGRALMFRCINGDLGEISDVEVRVSLAFWEGTGPTRIRRFHNLGLERHRVEFFSLNWTVVHPIDKDSPLAGMHAADLRAAELELLVLASAHEETFSTRIISRTSYYEDEITLDGKFADMYIDAPDHVITVDIGRLDRIERLDEGATGTPPPGEKQSTLSR